MDIDFSSSNIDAYSQLEMVIGSLESLQDDLGDTNNEVANQYLRSLYESLRTTQKGLNLLEAPSIQENSHLTTADIVALLITESKRTKEHVAGAMANDIKLLQETVRAKYADSIKKLEEASEKQKKADKLSLGLDIFKWCMLAVSIILIVASVIATICTFGGCTPLLVASIALLCISVGMIIASYVPVDGDKTSMDLATEKLSKAIADGAKQRYRDNYSVNGRKWDDLSEDEQQVALNKAEEEGIYGAMGVMISIQVILLIASLGVSAGQAATAGANASIGVTNATKSAVASAMEAVKQFIQQNLNAIASLVRKITMAMTLVKATAEISASGVRVQQAVTEAEAISDSAEADFIKASIKLNDSDKAQIEEILKELLEAIAANDEAVGNILKEDDATRRKMNLNLMSAQTA